MSAPKEVAVGSTCYFWFAANTTAGSAGDGATPLSDGRLAGAASGAAPTASGTPTLLTHANYSDGLHEIAIDTTGYAEGEYAVFCTLTISSVNPAGWVGSFIVRAAASTLYELVQAILVDTCTTLDGRIPAALTANGNMKSSLMEILATALTETSGLLAAAFKKFFNVATPTGTVNSIPDAVAGAAGGLFIAGTNAATSVTTALTANITGNLSGSIGSLGTTAKTDVNAEVVDALNTDTYAEPGQELPAATNTLVKKIGYLFKAWRNKITQDGTDYKLYADDTTTVDQKASVTDAAGTFTKGEIAGGP